LKTNPEGTSVFSPGLGDPTQGQPPVSSRKGPPSPDLSRRWILLLLLALVTVVGGGSWFYVVQERNYRDKAVNQLESIARLKANQIVNWRRERWADAATLTDSPFLAESLERFLSGAVSPSEDELRVKFASLQTHYGYADVVLVDKEGALSIALSGRNRKTFEEEISALQSAFKERSPKFADLHWESGFSTPRLTIVSPVFSSAGSPLGAIMLVCDAGTFLYPLIQSWPTPSDTAETILFRRDGDAVLYLNDLKYYPRAPLRLRVSLQRENVPAVLAVAGESGAVEGLDYRGTNVVAVVLPIQDSPWFIEAKVDVAEVYSAWHFEALLIILLLSGVTGVLVAVGFVGWQRNKRSFYQSLYESESLLRQSRERFHEIFEQAPLGVALIHPETAGIEEFNTRFLEICGFSRDDVGRADWLDVFHPEDAVEIREQMTQLATGGRPGILQEARLLHGDGSLVWTRVRVSPFLAGSDRAVQYLCMVEDVTAVKKAEAERRRLEEDYRVLFREMLNGFALHEIICDAEGRPVDYRFLAVNPAFERMTGLSAEEIVGKTVLEVLPGTESSWIEAYGRVALTGEPAFFENGHEGLGRYFEVTAFRPAPQQFACIFSDVSERKKAEQERARLNAALTAKNTELEQMVYVASHDLRSPLVNIEGYSKELDYTVKELKDLLAGNLPAELAPEIVPLLDQEIPEALRFIHTSASKMDSLLAGLLRLSRTGRAALTIEALNMNQLVREVLDSFEFQLKETGILPEVGELPPCRGDALQVNQVFSNLVGNALKYRDPVRPGVLKITGRFEESRVVYCVEDNGIGIDPAHGAKVFEIFHRLNPSHGPGEGLGLTIVKRIVERLGGSIWLESSLGEGCRFFVALPSAAKRKH